MIDADSSESRDLRLQKAEWLARKVDAFVWGKGTELGASRAAVRLGLEPSTVYAVLNGPKVKSVKTDAWMVSARKYASPKRFKVYEAIRTNPQASLPEIAEIANVSLRYVQKVASDLRVNGGVMHEAPIMSKWLDDEAEGK